MSELTLLIASVEALFKPLEARISAIEKRMNRKFHGTSGYTKGCRCDVCRTGRMDQMRAWRKKKRSSV
jgi:hypothetical protein